MNIQMKFNTFNKSQEAKEDTDHSFGVVPLWWKQSEIGLLLTELSQGTRNAAQRNLLGAQQ